MRVLIYEPSHTGHHFAYLSRMLPAFVELPISLALATTPEGAASENFQQSLSKFGEHLDVLPICRPAIKNKPIRNALRRMEDLRTAIDEWNPDHVCVFYADGLWQWLTMQSMFASKPVLAGPTSEAWVFRGGFAYPGQKGLAHGVRRWLWKQMLRRGVFTKVHLHDELLCDFSEAVSNVRSEIALVPDPVAIPSPTTTANSLAGNDSIGCAASETADARRLLNLPDEGFIVSCIGMADSRKGVPLAVEAIANLAEQQDARQTVRLFIAGPHAEEVLKLLAQPRYRKLVDSRIIISADRFLSDDDMLHAAMASDIVLAPYVNHSGRSSIILWAAAAGKPVVAVDRGCIRHVVETQRLGVVCDVRNTQLFAGTIIKQLATPWTDADRQRVQNYAQWHSIENYQAMCSKFVRERLADRRP